MADDGDQLRRALSRLLGTGRAREPSADPARLAALVEAARTRDYFEVLGVDRSCSAADAGAAAGALMGWLDDVARLPGPAPEGVADARQVVADARDVLADDERRDAYRRALEPG